MASCPKCGDVGLRHALVLDELPAYACERCDGLLLNLVVYRHWRESHPPTPADETVAPDDVEVDDSTAVLSCPKCRAIMTKYRFSADVPNRIDYCAHCEELWFDAGEWDLVASTARSGHLAEIFAQPWQRKLRRQISADMELSRMKTLLADDYERLSDIESWLRDHPHRAQIIARLSRPSKG